MSKVKEKVSTIEDLCNTGSTGELHEVGRGLAEIHPTLQQNFMRVVIGFIQAEAEKQYYDDRNKATVELCRDLMRVIENSQYYYKGRVYLPFI